MLLRFMKILHLMLDWVFTDAAVSVFRSFEKSLGFENDFVCLREDDSTTFSKIKLTSDVRWVRVGSEAYRKLLEKGRYDVVLVGWTGRLEREFVLSLDKDVIVMWCTWGQDYMRFSGIWLYGLRTTLFWVRMYSIKTVLKTLVAYLLAKLSLVRYLPYLDCRFARRINFFSTVVPTEEEYVRKLVGRHAVKLPYYWFETTRANSDCDVAVDLSKRRIWVGNSGAITNNHLDLFHVLRNVSEDYELYVPLSYSLNGERVTERIVQTGVKMFGNRFVPIRDFKPLDEYAAMMRECSVFVFGHRRQQSVGNIGIALRNGGCVFMNPVSPVYVYYLQNGVKIYPLSRLRELEKVLAEFTALQRKNICRYNELRKREKFVDEMLQTVEFLNNEVRAKGGLRSKM